MGGEGERCISRWGVEGLLVGGEGESCVGGMRKGRTKDDSVTGKVRGALCCWERCVNHLMRRQLSWQESSRPVGVGSSEFPIGNNTNY